MFDSLCIRRQTLSGSPIDIGFLAEALVFYGRVHVVAEPGAFKYLVRVCSPDTLLASLEEGVLQVSYLENQLGVSTIKVGSQERHGLHMVQAVKHKFQEFAPDFFREVTGKSGKGRRLAEKFMRLVPVVTYGEADTAAAADDFRDDQYVLQATLDLLSQIAPEYVPPKIASFRVLNEPDALIVETNINFREANESYQRRFPDSSIDEALVMSHIFGTGADLRFSAAKSSDIAMSPERSAIAAVKFSELLRQRGVRDRNLEVFQEWIFAEGRAIREAVNSGRRNFQDVLKLVSEGRKFKDWILNKPEDADLRQEYCRAISKVGWAEALPAKRLRWLIFTAAGAIAGVMASNPVVGTAFGVGVSAADQFLCDRLVSGWKPNTFIEGRLREFVAATR